MSSDTHGIGLFADQFIKKGDFIYKPSSLLDVDITEQELRDLTSEEQTEVKYYGYFNQKTQRWHVAFDAIRILNHADENNANVTQDINMVMIAKRDIQLGEELLQDYVEIYPDGSEHFKRINNSIS